MAGCMELIFFASLGHSRWCFVLLFLHDLMNGFSSAGFEFRRFVAPVACIEGASNSASALVALVSVAEGALATCLAVSASFACGLGCQPLC